MDPLSNEPRKVPDTSIPISTFTVNTHISALTGLDKLSEQQQQQPLASPKGDGLMAPPSPLGLSTGRPVYKPLTIKYDEAEEDDDDEDDEDDDEDDDPIIADDDEDEDDPEDDGGEYGRGGRGEFERDFPARTSIDFGEDGRVESSPGKGPSYGVGGGDDEDTDSPRLPDRCGNPITNNQMFTVDNNQASSYTSRFVPAGGRGLQNECRGAELGLLSLSPPRLYYVPASAAAASGATQATIPF